MINPFYPVKNDLQEAPRPFTRARRQVHPSAPAHPLAGVRRVHGACILPGVPGAPHIRSHHSHSPPELD